LRYFELLTYPCLWCVFVSTAMIVLYTGAGNIIDGTVEGALE